MRTPASFGESRIPRAPRRTAKLLPWRRFLLLWLLLLPLVVVVRGDCELESLEVLRAADPTWVPNAIVDVGANVGCWTTAGRQLFPNTKFWMLEAFRGFTDKLEDTKARQPEGTVDFAIEVLSATDNEEVNFWAEGKTGNSMFPQLLGNGGKGHAGITPVTRTTKTLDKARRDSFLASERIDVLKLDVQGAELEVLKGATELLKEVSLVQLEASVVEYNQGGSCYFEVDDFLRQHGFYLYDLGDPQRNERLFRSTGVGQFDSLYLRPSSEHLPEAVKRLGPNLCGTGNHENQPLPWLGSSPPTSANTTSTTGTDTDDHDHADDDHQMEIKWVEAAPGVVVPTHPLLGHAATLLVGILAGRFLVPRRPKGTAKIT